MSIYTEWDSGLAAGQQGNEACLDGSLQEQQHLPIQQGQHLIGQMHLMWTPTCHSHYLQIDIHVPAQAAALRITQRDPSSSPTPNADVPPHQSYSLLTDYAGGLSEENWAVSPLLFQSPGAGRIAATTFIIFPDGSSIHTTLEWFPPEHV